MVHSGDHFKELGVWVIKFNDVAILLNPLIIIIIRLIITNNN